MSDFVSSFASKIRAMEDAARRSGVGGRLKYVTGSFLGLVEPASKCPGSPNTTAQVMLFIHPS